MNANTLGHLFAVTNFGESHGPAIGCVIDGCPPQMELSEADIQPDLDRRRPGSSKFVTQRQESDRVQILSGVFNGKTTGTPICLLIPNTDQRSNDYSEIAAAFRPGHADYTYWQRYGIRDPRGGGRSSARLTAPMVAAGAVAKKWLRQHFNIQLQACVTQIGEIDLAVDDWQQVFANPFFAATTQLTQAEEYLTQIRKNGNSCGARLWLKAQNVPPGWGAPLFNKLDADIAQVMMGLNAVKAVEIGAGTGVAAQLGSEHGDEMTMSGFRSNNAGGILGGISSGQDIDVYLSIKPTSSILLAKNSVTIHGAETKLQTKGRHDPCVGLRAVPVATALLALVLMEHALYWRAQCGDVKLPFRLGGNSEK